jgi:hypothetical protein
MVSWRFLHTKFKTFLTEGKPIESFFYSSTENSREMRITWTKLNNVQEFEEWLLKKAMMEEAGMEAGILTSIGGD